MQSNPTKYNVPWPLMVILIMGPLIVITAGMLFYKSQEKKIVYEKQNELAAISSLKAENISKWRMEHIRDGEIIHNNIPLNKQISYFIKNDKQAEIKKELLLWINAFIKNYDYHSIILLDSAATVKLYFTTDSTIPYPLIMQNFEVSDQSEITFTDLHYSNDLPWAHIDLIIPLNSADNNKSGIGTLVLRINPYINLFPLIQSWPTPSKSSETILLRREGDSVLYLNELRHKKNTVLTLKLPLSNRNLPSSAAASGFEGPFAGIDYRNIPVISFLEKIPDSNWFMVSKVDKKEIYSPLNELIVLTSVIVFLIILSAAVILGVYLRNQRIRFYKEQLDSELKRTNAEEAFRLLSIRNEAILAAVPNIIMEVDKNKVYKWANKAGYEFFGNDVIGKEAAFYFEGDQDIYTVISPLLNGDNDKIYVESWQRRLDGEQRLLAWWCQSLKDGNGEVTGVLSSAYDITEQKRYETTLKENEAHLRELNATKDKFFSIISHDLKSPFTSIIGFSELLIEKVRNKDYDGIERFGSIIHDSSWRAMDLLANLTEWSRFQTGRIDFRPKEIDIVPIINEVTDLHNASALQKIVTITCNLPTHLNVVADKSMISTVLRNLISNSIKFSNQGGEITVSAVQRDDEAIIEVKDSGIGIPKDTIPRLFRIEESFSTPGTGNEMGTGLGLILCKEFVSKHGGKIWAESEVGRGSRFSFTIPV